MITRSPVLAGLTVLALTIYEMALGGGRGQAHEASPVAPAQSTARQPPFICSLVASSQNGGTHIEVRLQAREAISATYALAVRGPGVSIDQGGNLTLPAGESTVLGESSVSSAANSLDATLTVMVGGRSYTCARQFE
jgi:hypothetical protein